MGFKSDIEIAQEYQPKKITEIAAKAGIDEDHLELYGKYKAKLDLTEIRKLPRKSKLILVTAISPTPAGEGSGSVYANGETVELKAEEALLIEDPMEEGIALTGEGRFMLARMKG